MNNYTVESIKGLMMGKATITELNKNGEAYVFPPFTAGELARAGESKKNYKWVGLDATPEILSFFTPKMFIIIAALWSLSVALRGELPFFTLMSILGVWFLHEWQGNRDDKFLFGGGVLMLIGFIGAPVFFKLLIFILALRFTLEGSGWFNRYQSAPENVVGFHEVNETIHGVAGEGIAGSNVGNAGTRAAGAEGEARFGEFLNKFSEKYPFVQVFHGLQFNPIGYSEADIDHAVVMGDRVFLLDSKNWKYGHYEWRESWINLFGPPLKEPERTVVRDGLSFSGGRVHLEESEKFWREYVDYAKTRSQYTRPKEDVRSYIVLTKDTQRGEYTIDNTLAPPQSTTINTIPEIMHILEEAANDEKNAFINRYLLFKMKQAMK